LHKKKVTIYGDGKQVRDVLYVGDLVKGFEMAFNSIKKTNGQIYNVGGGPKNTISIWMEFGPILEKLLGSKLNATFKKERPGDQKIFISDIRKAVKDFGWTPKTDFPSGLKNLHNWSREFHK